MWGLGIRFKFKVSGLKSNVLLRRQSVGSIPVGATNKADPEATSFGVLYFMSACFGVALLCPKATDEGGLL